MVVEWQIQFVKTNKMYNPESEPELNYELGVTMVDSLGSLTVTNILRWGQVLIVGEAMRVWGEGVYENSVLFS